MLTIGEMPAHKHIFYYKFDNSADNITSQSWSIVVSYTVNAASDDGAGTYSAGSGEAHNNIQPYLSVYMWRRVS